ncbi:telomerase reverse transcriptase-like [Pogonomyrmex barbatus]|uniref:Telomerase reverse transcriptase n=1 Tax=Pogonomyrmex barbatus TaxID=144034 RepID=A0A8N1SAJ4_9HYME|nr:telomerase reverse transcriptase-like [Pogonomyrmex barbatus]
MKSVVIPMQIKKPKLVRTKILMNKLYKLIYQQKVKFNNQVYSIRRGVPQGIRISSILSDIYYQHMINEKFAEYANNGLFDAIYVDDIIYITESDHYAKMFLEKIRNGIPEYNVTFNPDKIQSKTNPSKGPIKIKFLKQIITL